MTDATPVTTTDNGAPAASDAHSQTVGADGPIVLHDHRLVEKLANFNREKVPERIVHAKGGGAFGRFVTTGDVSQYTRAALFQPGVETEMLARFSTVAGEQGSPDTWRDPRGFALKFYTSEGNYDLVGNNTPVFFIRDGMKFPDFIHSQKRLPGSHLRDHDMQWDFWTLSPESAHQVTWLMGDRGLPASWRQMDGFGSHTYQWINAEGERSWVKYHFKSDQGNAILTQDDADRIAGEDADFHIRDLSTAIERGEFPTWTLSVQVMPYADAAGYRFNPFDLTKVWPHSDYPLIEVGTMTLDRNPENYFAQIEQAAFAPSNFVPGIATSPDKMLLARIFSYADAHRYRVGVNHQQLPVNAPKTEVHSYSKDGAARYHFSEATAPVYAPNSVGGPAADPQAAGDTGGWESDGELVRSAATLHAEDDDFGQAGSLVRDVMDDEQRDRLVANIVGHVSKVTRPDLLERVFQYWNSVDPILGARVRAGVSPEAPGSNEDPATVGVPA
ncbi:MULTISPECIES: catalase [Frigoribacterium]|jgi:catalase|uniref:catalase n=1 Tax=Frigoribacterium TaxID=96492 RepID=UPI0006FFE712|nr:MULTISPECIES: catalase [Frigoribacterium]KQR46010.1 catalase [Frigoribacterium sp. Leaf164]MBD8661610.1 catalase [Frigoribacterium sp. CFBP 8754]MBD8729172.1 catalase [Frigoribacterium sp. CFBP 13707]NII52611.1 catalase [Frigoribacterium endophyticum]QNE44214.1 catalase [Frigoribacterium sp. NBH87]